MCGGREGEREGEGGGKGRRLGREREREGNMLEWTCMYTTCLSHDYHACLVIVSTT